MNTNPNEDRLIALIVGRHKAIAQRVFPNLVVDTGRLQRALALVHCNGTPLNLDAFACGSEERLLSDVVDIAKNIDWATGRLRNNFVPRFAETEK